MRSLFPENAILAAWQDTLTRRGSEPAVIATDRSVLRTFEEIDAEANEIAAGLDQFSPRSVIGVQIGNNERWPAVVLALFRRELIALPLGRHVESSELASALQTCGASAVITIEHGSLAVHAVRDIAAPEWTEPAPDFLKLTSGTTSAPRAIRFRAHQLLADCDNICRTMGIGSSDVNFGVIPFSHSYGFSNLITPLLCRGVSLVASEDRIPRAILDGLASSEATVFPGMPIFFDKIAGMANTPALPKLRLCISAGAPLNKTVAEAFTRKYGLKVHTFYGSSECGGIGYDSSDEPLYEDGFAGRPMLGVQIDRENTEDPAPIRVRGDAVGDGYYPIDDPETLGVNGFVPGDLIRWSGDDMWIAGRVSDVINVAGRKLNPGEVEVRVQAHPNVRQAIVFGVSSPLRGEEPVLCVSGEGLHEADLLRFCRANLSEWQMPRAVWIVEEIPVNERGKVSRRLLAEQYQATRA